MISFKITTERREFSGHFETQFRARDGNACHFRVQQVNGGGGHSLSNKIGDTGNANSTRLEKKRMDVCALVLKFPTVKALAVMVATGTSATTTGITELAEAVAAAPATALVLLLL